MTGLDINIRIYELKTKAKQRAYRRFVDLGHDYNASLRGKTKCLYQQIETEELQKIQPEIDKLQEAAA